MKYLKIIGMIVGIYILGTVGFSVYGAFNTHNDVGVKGISMQDYGFSDGSKQKIYPLEKCDISDVCAFKCINEKCLTQEEAMGDLVFKTVKDKKDNCYWFEGNADKNTSWDSRWYGWLCDKELEIIGVVK